MPKERVLITVKTYPTLSRKYGEMVCTAGVRTDGSWVRLYPVSFRRLEEDDQYAKFDWIEAELVKSSSDPRPETYRLVDSKDMRRVGHVGTDKNWRERRQLLLNPSRVYDRLQPLLDGAKANTLSLAVFKPLEFLISPGRSVSVTGIRPRLPQCVRLLPKATSLKMKPGGRHSS